MPIPNTKTELLLAIRLRYHKLAAELEGIPEDGIHTKTMEGHAQNTWMSVHNLVAYLVGWGTLVLKWHAQKAQGLEVDFPDTGYSWNRLGQLAQKMYADHAEEDFATLRKKLEVTTLSICRLVEETSEKDLYEIPWYGKWPLGRMIQLNTSSPFQNATNRLRKWKKSKNGTPQPMAGE